MEWLKNNVPLISVFMLILGMVEISIYYKFFQINIVSFLDISEILQLQFTLYFLILWIILVVTPFLYMPLEKFYKKHIIARADKFDKISERIAKVGTKIEGMIDKVPVEERKELRDMLKEHNDLKYSHANDVRDFANIKSFIGIFLLIISFAVASAISAVNAYYDAYRLRDVSKFEVSMKVGDKEMKTNRYYRFLGRTKNFIFFHDYNKRESYVISNSDVKDLVFKGGLDYSQLDTMTIKKP